MKLKSSSTDIDLGSNPPPPAQPLRLSTKHTEKRPLVVPLFCATHVAPPLGAVLRAEIAWRFSSERLISGMTSRTLATFGSATDWM